MKASYIFLIPILHSCLLNAQINGTNLSKTIGTTNLSFELFARNIVKQDKTDFEEAKNLLNFVCNSLQWLSTDYKQRTVKEILARGGGNCYELANVYMTFFKALNIKYRSVAEINIQPNSESRQENAMHRIEQYGNKMSVFGRQHNDHRWVEVYDSLSNKWVPVDPTMNVIGTEQWLKARVWFGERITIDTAISNDMIVPFAIFVTDSSKTNMIVSRSELYLIKEFDNLYNNKLSQLPSWNRWITLIKFLEEPAKSAFEGKENLHLYTNKISELADTYKDLKTEYTKFSMQLRLIANPGCGSVGQTTFNISS